MKAFRYFARNYPVHSAVVLGCLLLATAIEGVGLTSVLPALQLAMADPGDEPVRDPNQLERTLAALFDHAGVTPTPEILLSLFVVAFLLKAVLVIFANRQVGFAVAHIATDLRLGLLRALLSARWTYFARLPVGRAANAIATEADRGSLAFHHLAEVLSFSIASALYMAIAAMVSWQATLAVLGAGVASVGTLNVLVRISGRAGRKQTRFLRALISRVTDTLQSVKVLKSMGRERLIVPLLEKDTRSLKVALRRRVYSKEALRALQEPIMAVFIAAALYVGWIVYHMPKADLLLIGFLFARTLGSINLLQRRYQSLAAETSGLWSLRDLIEQADREREVALGTRAPSLETGIEIDHARVVFDGRSVLEDLCLEVPAGRMTALVGASGSGKTTTADLITGLVRPESGRVLVDGVPLDEIDLAAWRRMIGYVPQDVLLLHDSVAANVSLGDPAVSEAAVEEALRDAGAWEFVSKLPQGIHAPTGERGTLFSGGQRQRIAVARALAHGARLLIFDEATASLDTASEAALWKTLERLRGRVTVLAISHQPTVASIADRIYRVIDGRAERVDPLAR